MKLAATKMVPSSVCGPSFFLGFRSLIFFFPPDLKKMEGKDPLDPLNINIPSEDEKYPLKRDSKAQNKDLFEICRTRFK